MDELSFKYYSLRLYQQIFIFLELQKLGTLSGFTNSLKLMAFDRPEDRSSQVIGKRRKKIRE